MMRRGGADGGTGAGILGILNSTDRGEKEKDKTGLRETRF